MDPPSSEAAANGERGSRSGNNANNNSSNSFNASHAAALGLLDPSALFANWNRDETLPSTPHSLFAAGIPASYNPLAPLPGYGMLGQSQFASPSVSAASSLSLNQASAAAWWSMASQLAAQDYLARLHASTSTSSSGRTPSSTAPASSSTFPAGFPGLSAADSLLASYTSAMNAAAHSKSSKSSRNSSSSNPIVRDSLSSEPIPSTSTASQASSSSKLRPVTNDTEAKFMAPSSGGMSSARTAESQATKKSGSCSKNRRRAATASGSSSSEPCSVSVLGSGSITSPTSSLSSLSSMAMSYPFFGNPLASLSLPLTSAPSNADSITIEKKKAARKPTEKQSSDSASIQVLRLPETSAANQTSSGSNGKARSQTVNGKPLALDVSSLIGKPSASSSSSVATNPDEVPLNLSMKTKEDAANAAANVAASTSSRLGRGVSMPKKNTVASLLAQSRNQRSTSPTLPGTSSSTTTPAPSHADLKSNLGLLTAMQELSNAKYSSSYLNGIKDSLNPGTGGDTTSAIQDLLRAASLLGSFGFGGASTGSTAAGGGNSCAASKNDSSSKTSSSGAANENGQSKPAEAHKGNGKTPDDIPASEESDSMEEDDSMLDSDDGWEGGADGDSRKRSADEDGAGERPFKRRRFVSDESALRLPMTLGWKRETVIRSIGKSGVRGEVTYFSPSGRRFRQYPDVVRYLERQGIASINRDNFSFSTRCIIGEFIQPLGDSANARGIRLGETEVRHLVDQIRIARGWKPRGRRMTEEEKEAVARQREAQRVQQRLEAQELARQAQEMKLQQRMERERALQAAKEARRQMREQEKMEKQEAQRREREMRTQQLMEARRKRQEELDRMREEEQQRKIQELNKQRELFYTAELERERRRQHTALIKALESRKRYEERERRREEMRAEKRAEREKKMEDRRKELESWRDQRSPAEDMELTDHKEMPNIPRIKNMKLAGKAFADVLMLYEFLHTFGETLGFDMESLPTLDSLQRALLYDSEAEEELLSIITHLLVCAIEDPGMPHPNRHTTILGQTLKQADITTTNVSEILRLYLQANGLGDVKLPVDKMGSSPVKLDLPDAEAFQMSEWLKKRPFLALNPTQKAAILGFMVNELLQNKAVIGQIDGAIEGQNTSRRDRWVVDSKIKKLKTLHSKKNRTSLSSNLCGMTASGGVQLKDHTGDDSTTHDETNHSAAGKKKDEVVEGEEHAEEAEEESGGEEDNGDAQDEDEDENLPADELKRKIERLSRQSAQMLTQLALSDLQLRALNLGQDRFRRRLWILPHAGGVYLEAIESSECNAGHLKTWDGKAPLVIGEPRWDEEDEEMKQVDPQPNGEPISDVKEEKMETDDEDVKPQIKEEPVESEPVEKEADECQVVVKTEESPEADESKPSENEAVAADPGTTETSVPSGESEPAAVSASEDMGAESVKVESADPSDQLPALWFSLFPRSPCDEHSLVIAGEGENRNDSAGVGEENVKEEMVAEEVKKNEVFPVPEELSRGWWRIADPEMVKSFLDALHSRGVREKELSRMLTRFMDFAKESCLKGNPKDLLLKEVKSIGVRMPGGAPIPDEDDAWSRETALRGDLLVLEQIEALEDRVASASMQVKGWKLPARATTEMNLVFRSVCEAVDEDDERVNPIELARERLLAIEEAIERRYLKAPLGHSKGELVLSVLSGSCPSDEPPKALVTWRESVKKCETAAQVAMCFYLLETSVAWDKSIMKASCQFCHSGDKEDQLLLCDGCDKGYHTYCFKPPMDNIPDGDWFCYECRNKATGQRNCIVCGKPGSKNCWVLCDQCPKAYHIDCLQPPLAKVPRGKWNCVLCQTKTPKRKSKKATTRDRVSESDASSTCGTTHNETLEASSSFANSPSSAAAPSPRRSSSSVANKRSLKEAVAKDKDLAPCRTIVDELEVHDEAWPFLLPVNTKQFPTYRKIIRLPMDISTIRRKLTDGIYKTREDFCADVRLIFKNCVTFNEDDSPVGKAGHSLRTYFDSRWAELTAAHH